MIKGSLHGSTPIVKRFSVENFSPVKIGPKMAVFRELRGVNVKFLSSNAEKAHPCAEPRRLTYITRENRFRRLGSSSLEDPPKKKPSKHFDARFRAYGKKKPLEGSRLNFACR